MPTKQISSFKVFRKVEALFTGGHVQVSSSGDFLWTPCGAVVNAILLQPLKLEESTDRLENDDGSPVSSICLFGEGGIVVAYANLLLREWRRVGGCLAEQKRWRSNHKAPIVCMDSWNDSKKPILATGGADFAVKIWDLMLRCCTHSFPGSPGIITSLRLLPDAVLIGNMNGELKLCSLDKTKSSEVVRMDVSPGNAVSDLLLIGSSLVVASRQGQIVVVDLDGFHKKMAVDTGEAVEALAIVDSKCTVLASRHKTTPMIMTGGEEGLLKLWQLKSGLCLWESPAAFFGEQVAITQILFNAPSTVYVVVTTDQNIVFLHSQTLEKMSQLVGYNEEILDLAFSGEGNSLLAVGTNSPDLRVYDRKTMSCELCTGHKQAILCVTCAPWDASLLATGSKDNDIRMWRVDGSGGVQSLLLASGHTNSVSSIRFSSNKSRFLVSVSHDMTLKLWPLPELPADSPHVRATTTVVAHSKDVACVDVSPNDRLLASCSMDKTIKVWRLEKKGKKTEVVPGGTIRGHDRGVWDVRFSPMDQVLASASGDCTVKIFALSDLSCVKTLEGHECAVLRLHFLSSGLQLVSADTGGLLKLWSIRASECVKTYEAHEDKIWALDVDQLTESVATGGADAKLLLWEDTTEEERAMADKDTTERVAKEQALANLLQRHKYPAALKLALTLGRPFASYEVLQELCRNSSENEDGELHKLMKSLDNEEIGALLEYVVGWNTNSRHAELAQKVLKEILSILSPEEMLQLPKCKQLVEGLLPYSERHFSRFSKLRQQACFLDYTWKCMRLAEVPGK